MTAEILDPAPRASGNRASGFERQERSPSSLTRPESQASRRHRWKPAVTRVWPPGARVMLELLDELADRFSAAVVELVRAAHPDALNGAVRRARF
jgi:hypothetical protein